MTVCNMTFTAQFGKKGHINVSLIQNHFLAPVLTTDATKHVQIWSEFQEKPSTALFGERERGWGEGGSKYRKRKKMKRGRETEREGREKRDNERGGGGRRERRRTRQRVRMADVGLKCQSNQILSFRKQKGTTCTSDPKYKLSNFNWFV